MELVVVLLSMNGGRMNNSFKSISDLPSYILTKQPAVFVNLWVPLGSYSIRYEVCEAEEGAFFRCSKSSPLLLNTESCVEKHVTSSDVGLIAKRLSELLEGEKLPDKQQLIGHAKDPSKFCVFVRTYTSSQFITAVGVQVLPEIKLLQKKVLAELEKVFDNLSAGPI